MDAISIPGSHGRLMHINCIYQLQDLPTALLSYE